MLQAIESVKLQTYENVEIIVVNDASTDERYYALKEDGFRIIHLSEGTRTLFGFPCAGYVRRMGIENSTGDYIAILDDDDVFFDIKLTAQLHEMIAKGYKICCSDALAGNGAFCPAKPYQFYIKGLNKAVVRQFKLPERSSFVLNHDIIQKHNFIIHSSVVFERKLYEMVGGYDDLKNGEEDHRLLIKMLYHTDCLFIQAPLLYYDARINELLMHKIISIIKHKLFR